MAITTCAVVTLALLYDVSLLLRWLSVATDIVRRTGMNLTTLSLYNEYYLSCCGHLAVGIYALTDRFPCFTPFL